MVLEAVMFCIDNSEWMRNGDYSPTRLEAQSEAVNYVARAKTEGNQETSVGVLSMASSRVRVHSSLTRNLGRIMNALATDVQCAGQSNFVGALKTAQLALKNRLNKNQRQRIIMFVGSPVEVDAKTLEKVGKQLKKNSVAVDIVNFGAENVANGNAEVLGAFVAAVNSSDNSHLVTIPPGPGMLSDAVVTSAIMGDAAAPAGAGAGGFGGAAGGDFGGFNAADDPELAMALQMSMQEEAARQAAAGGDAPADGGAAADGADGGAADVAMDDEEALLQQAIAMSIAASEEAAAAQQAKPADEPADAEMAAADGGAAAGAAAGGDVDIAQALDDPSFIESLLDEVGVDKADADIDDILQGLNDDGSKDKKKEDKK